MAVNWAYGVGNSLVVDIGFEKTDITPVLDFIICEAERDTIPIGGEDMTQHLSKILGGEEKGWGRDATEQLKCSPICEIMDLTKYPIAGTIAADAADPLRKTKISAGAPLEEDEEEGITNVAAIVASGKTHEYLAKKEKERQEAQRGAQKNLPNWRREYNKFWLIEKRKDGDVVMADDWEEDKKIDDHEDERASENGRDEQPRLEQPPLPDHQTNPDDTASNITVPTIPGGEPVPQNTETAADSPSTTPPPAPISTPKTAEEIEAEVRSAREREEARMKEKEKRREEKRAKVAESSLGPNEVRKEVEVGLERFKAAECGILEILADATYRIVSRVHDISRRQELWDSMIIVGNGSKIRGKPYYKYLDIIQNY